MPSTILKRYPRLRTSRDGERSAAWLELFFDLVFVLAVAELARYLQDNLNLGGFLGFAGLFVPVWWTWICFSFCADQFDPDNVIYRIVMLSTITQRLRDNSRSLSRSNPVKVIWLYLVALA